MKTVPEIIESLTKRLAKIAVEYDVTQSILTQIIEANRPTPEAKAEPPLLRLTPKSKAATITGSLRSRVAAWVSKQAGEFTTDQGADALGLTTQQFVPALRRLVESGTVRKLGKTRFMRVPFATVDKPSKSTAVVDALAANAAKIRAEIEVPRDSDAGQYS